MTISTTSNVVTAPGNGATTVFSFSFVADSSSYISVIYTDAYGNQTTLAPAQYTLFINPPATGQLWGVGGTVTYPLSGGPIASGTTLTIARILPLTQNTSISNQGDFYPTVTEKALDTLCMQDQQYANNSARAIQFPITDTASGILPAAAARAFKYVTFDAVGNAIVASGTAAQPTGNFIGSNVGGTPNAISVGTTLPNSFSLVDGNVVTFNPTQVNTGPTTLNIGNTGAVPLYKPSFAGPVNLVAGDVDGLPIIVQYSASGNYYLGLNIVPVGYETTVSTNQNVGFINCFTAYVATSAITMTIAQSTTLTSFWYVDIFAQNGNVTIAINAADKINNGTTGAGLVMLSGTSGRITTDAAGNLFLNGTAVVPQVSNVAPTTLSVATYGGLPSASGSTNATAFANWWAALAAAPSGTAGFIPAGTYNIASALTWDFAGARASKGITIYGAGEYQTILNFTQGTGTCLQIEASGGAGPGSLVPYYYNTIRDIGFVASTTGMAFKIGQDNGADSIQGTLFQNLIFQNGNSSSGGALRINGATQNTFINIQGSAYPATAGRAGSGAGLELVNAAFNSFVACTFGNANIGVSIINLGNAAVGFSYGNTFLSLDIENVQYCVKQSSPAASRNKFILGQWYTIFAGGYAVSCSAAGSSSAGAALIVEDVNLSLNPLYGGGGTSPALDPSNQVGVIFKGGSYGTVSTPSFPATTVLYTNTTGQSQSVVWWGGTITAIAINALSVGTTVNSAALAPGDTIKFTYTGSPSWYFRNQVI